MDTINAAATRNADIAIATNDTLCENVVSALYDFLLNSSNAEDFPNMGERKLSLDERIYRSIRDMLFLKYIGLEVEVYARHNRDDVLSGEVFKDD